MANHATKQSNEAHRPMGSSNVPVLFSLKNVQPHILNAPPATPSKEKTPKVVADKASVASHSGFAAAGASSHAPVDAAALSRPTKAASGSPILRTLGTVLLILLVILVIRMSVPGGSQGTKIARQKSPDDVSVDSPKIPELSVKPASQVVVKPASQVIVPELPQLAESTVDLEPKAESKLLPPTKGVEDGKTKSEVILQLGAAGPDRQASLEKEPLPSLELSGGSPVPALLAAVPSSSPTAANPGFSNSLQGESSAPSSITLGESVPNEQLSQSRSNAAPATVAPYVATRPELYSNDDIRETSTPNLESMAELITLYRKGLVDGSGTPASPSASGGMTAKQVSTGSSPQQFQSAASAPQSSAPFIPTTPYAPLSAATNWPTTSIAIPASQVGAGGRSEVVSPGNTALPMSGQSYPPPQRTYEPLTMPAQDALNNTSGSSQSSTNRYQATLIRQPNDGGSTPIAQPKQPYTPVGPSATVPASAGASGSSFGYPPINVPSN